MCGCVCASALRASIAVEGHWLGRLREIRQVKFGSWFHAAEERLPSLSRPAPSCPTFAPPLPPPIAATATSPASCPLWCGTCRMRGTSLTAQRTTLASSRSASASDLAHVSLAPCAARRQPLAHLRKNHPGANRHLTQCRRAHSSALLCGSPAALGRPRQRQQRAPASGHRMAWKACCELMAPGHSSSGVVPCHRMACAGPGIVHL